MKFSTWDYTVLTGFLASGVVVGKFYFSGHWIALLPVTATSTHPSF